MHFILIYSNKLMLKLLVVLVYYQFIYVYRYIYRMYIVYSFTLKQKYAIKINIYLRYKKLNYQIYRYIVI